MDDWVLLLVIIIALQVIIDFLLVVALGMQIGLHQLVRQRISYLEDKLSIIKREVERWKP